MSSSSASSARGDGVPPADPVVARPASTVMVVRDGHHPTAPLEVLMVRRSLNSDFVGGVYVFPGGAVDPVDASPAAARLCIGRTDAEANAQLELDAGGLAHWVAAVRECFEEAGLLLAERAGAGPLSWEEPAEATRFAEHRSAINGRRQSFVQMSTDEDLVIDAGSVHYFAHWVTPAGQHRRYDTRFFVAPAPPGQHPAHDESETISAVWIRPADALAEHRAGRYELILPTIRNLQAIERFATAGALLEAAAQIGRVDSVVPRMVVEGNGVRIVLPGDPGYDVAVHSLESLPENVDLNEVIRAAALRANSAPDEA